jgi:hypothetical protein
MMMMMMMMMMIMIISALILMITRRDRGMADHPHSSVGTHHPGILHAPPLSFFFLRPGLSSPRSRSRLLPVLPPLLLPTASVCMRSSPLPGGGMNGLSRNSLGSTCRQGPPTGEGGGERVGEIVGVTILMSS